MQVPKDQRQILIFVARFLQRRSPVVAPFLFGAGFALVREILGSFSIPVAVIWAILVLPLGLIALSYPLLSRKRALIVSLFGVAGSLFLSPALWWHFHGYWTPTGWGWFACGGAIVWLLMAGLALAAVTIRRRFWPRRGVGRCRVCGYSRFGLGGDRCPECGTLTRTAGRTLDFVDEPASESSA